MSLETGSEKLGKRLPSRGVPRVRDLTLQSIELDRRHEAPVMPLDARPPR